MRERSYQDRARERVRERGRDGEGGTERGRKQVREMEGEVEKNMEGGGGREGEMDIATRMPSLSDGMGGGGCSFFLGVWVHLSLPCTPCMSSANRPRYSACRE